MLLKIFLKVPEDVFEHKTNLERIVSDKYTF